MTDLQQVKQAVEAWADSANSHGLLSGKSVDTLRNFNAQTPANLFSVEERPLVVGFFGGTGVGKSTLLNRLAGEDVARTGVERPTSREVTLFLHSTVHVDHLPADYPTHLVKTAFHNNDDNRQVLWIDMPDFDSAETANRQLVDAWLPHIDMLIYVVSPERYRDDNGWRMLLQHGGKHAWVFVINHWDRGHDAQRTDFKNLLSEAGLAAPYLYCTDSSQAPAQDEFDLLRELVQSMASDKTVAILEQRGILARINEIRSFVNDAIANMGEQNDYAQVKQQWDEFWKTESSDILQGLNWKYPHLTQGYAADEPGLFKAVLQKLTGRDTQNRKEIASVIHGQALFEADQALPIIDDINEVVQIAVRRGLPAQALRDAIGPLASQLEERLNQPVEEARDTALANPGSALQRKMTQIFSVAASILPVGALLWAGYRIVYAFHAGGSSPAQYLGSSFAVNAVLLVGLAWLLPYLIARKLTPSLPRAAAKGMRHGAGLALSELQQRVHAAIDKVDENRQQHVAMGQAVFDDLPAGAAQILPEQIDRALMQKSPIDNAH